MTRKTLDGFFRDAILLPGARARKQPRKPESFQIVTRTSGVLRWLLVQQDARLRVTKWSLGGRCTDRVLSLPAMLFCIRLYRDVYDQVYAYFLRTAYRGPATPLYQTILPNQAASGWVCMGTNAARDQLMRQTARLMSDTAKADAVLTAYWDTHFGTDYISRLSNAGRLHPSLASLARWEAASRHRPDFITTISWEPWGSVQDFFDQHRKD